MGKYYEVRLENIGVETCYRTGGIASSEEDRGWDGIIEVNTSLLNIKECKKESIKTVKRFFGGYKEIKYSYVAYEPFCIICEEKNDYLKDIITGKSFKKVNRKYTNCNRKDYFSKEILFSTDHELSSDDVVEKLKSLTDEDINRYRTAMNKLEQAISIGYEEDIIYEENKKKALQKKLQYNEDFIKNFKNR